MSNSASVRRVRPSRAARAGARLEGLASVPGTAEGPRTRPGYVSRPQLVGRLIRAQTTLALLCAPAGYGKTTLATEWDGWDARPFAWVTIGDEHDRCANDLVTAIEQSLDDVAPTQAR